MRVQGTGHLAALERKAQLVNKLQRQLGCQLDSSLRSSLLVAGLDAAALLQQLRQERGRLFGGQVKLMPAALEAVALPPAAPPAAPKPAAPAASTPAAPADGGKQLLKASTGRPLAPPSHVKHAGSGDDSASSDDDAGPPPAGARHGSKHNRAAATPSSGRMAKKQKGHGVAKQQPKQQRGQQRDQQHSKRQWSPRSPGV